MAAKTYCLDTNVLIHDPDSIFKFEDNELIIPIIVLEELDKFKKDMDEKGRNARFINRKLDEMRKLGKLSDGIPLPNGGTIRVDTQWYAIDGIHEAKNDNQILECARANNAILVTKDINLRVKADALGAPAEDYENGKVDVGDELYSGHIEVYVGKEYIDAVAKAPSEFYGEYTYGMHPPYENQFVTLVNECDAKQTLLTRVQKGKLAKVVRNKPVEGISPRNREQQLAFDILMDPEISLVTLVGKAGCGKTLLALAAGLGQIDGKKYKRMLVSRPVVSMGKEIGFLPGDIEEKMAPWMMPIKDNIEQIVRYSPKDEDDDIEEKKPGRRSTKPGRTMNSSAQVPGGPKLSAMDELKLQGILEVSALTYIRGRSIPKQFMIIDEAQNLTPHEVKTIITRAGEGTKIILTGDPYQIDTPYLDVYSNGLSYVVDRFKGQSIYGHVHLTKGERSLLAELAAELL